MLKNHSTLLIQLLYTRQKWPDKGKLGKVIKIIFRKVKQDYHTAYINHLRFHGYDGPDPQLLQTDIALLTLIDLCLSSPGKDLAQYSFSLPQQACYILLPRTVKQLQPEWVK